MILSPRLFDIEVAVLGLTRDLDAGAELADEELLRVYILREKLDAIIAGERRNIYEIAWKKWHRALKRKTA